MTTALEPKLPTFQNEQIKRPEILAPAGTHEAMKAAVENGADAVYFGLQQFNARIRAANFSIEELPQIMEYLHGRGVRGYVTMNTLIFSSELAEAAKALKQISDAGVDAILVQDLGIAKLANELVPDLPVHSSTQMTITNAEGVHALDALGINVERVVAAREMDRGDLRKMREGVEREVEVFVHGAICVAYSGQCLTSEALGGRSANRGECAQACRLPYDLIVDGKEKEMGDLKYLLSPKDLSAYEDIDELMDAGIASLKIEGRLKTPQYVAATVQSYRAAVDQALEGRKPVLDQATQNKLAMTFSRGLTGGYLHENNHQTVVEGRFPKKRGLYLGKVLAVDGRQVLVEFEAPVRIGDGVVFDAGNPDQDEIGGNIYFLLDQQKRELKEFNPNKNERKKFWIEFGKGRINLHKVAQGNLIWKTRDPKLDRELESSYSGDTIHHRRPVDLVVDVKIGKPLQLEMTDGDGHHVSIMDFQDAEKAIRRPLTEETLRDQLGRLGNTPFELRELTANIVGEVIVPVSRLNQLRRRAVDLLIDERKNSRKGRRHHVEVFERFSSEVASHKTNDSVPVSNSSLSILCRTLQQVEAAVEFSKDNDQGLGAIYTDFEDIRNNKEARELIPSGGPKFIPATLRILKPGENPYARTLLKCDPDALLIRSLGGWQLMKEEASEVPLIGDFSLNISNEFTANLLKQNGFSYLTPSYDLNIDQLSDLLKAAPPQWFEVTLHQYMPMFHMEHCVFCRFLSTGTNASNCGRPCEKHSVKIKDRMGFEHPIKADAGCRNTVFNATAQSASAYMKKLHDSGVRKFRIDMLEENSEQTKEILSYYLPVVRGERDGSQLWRELKVSSKLGVTRGSLDHE